MNGDQDFVTAACVILNYNDCDTCLSLLTGIAGYEALNHIVVVDNQSTDDSYERLYRYSLGNEKIHLIRADKNGGYGYGNNIGIRYAYHTLQADYVLVANPDVEFSEDCVIEMREVLQREKACAAVAPRAVSPQGVQPSDQAWMIPGALKYLLICSRVFSRISRSINYDRDFYEGKPLCYVDCVPGSLIMVNAQIMIEDGMHDEEIFLYCEETVLGIKLKKKGYHTAILPKLSYLHHHSVSIDKSYKSRYSKVKLLHQSKLVVLRNHYQLNHLQMWAARAFLAFCSLEARGIDIYRRIKDNRS